MLEKIICTMDAGDYISVIACIISMLGAIVSIFSYNLSKKEYKLQQQLYSDGLANYSFEIIDCCIKDNKDYEHIQYWFNLLIKNLSDKQTSIVKYCLTLDCLDGITYKPTYCSFDSKEYLDLTILGMPQNIDAHSSIRGWCVFELPRETFKNLQIENQTITLTDIHHKSTLQKPILISEELINYDN